MGHITTLADQRAMFLVACVVWLLGGVIAQLTIVGLRTSPSRQRPVTQLFRIRALVACQVMFVLGPLVSFIAQFGLRNTISLVTTSYGHVGPFALLPYLYMVLVSIGVALMTLEYIDSHRSTYAYGLGGNVYVAQKDLYMHTIHGLPLRTVMLTSNGEELDYAM